MASSDDTAPHELDAFLSARMRRPQRHRLLQGYPAMPQMRLAAPRFGQVSDGTRGLDGALTTTRQAQRESLERLRAGLAEPLPAWITTAEHRERYETQIRPHNERSAADLDALLATPDPAEPAFVNLDATRELIVGVMPHTQCTPKVKGCGFCTFPQDGNDKRARGHTIRAVRAEIERLFEQHPELRRRPVAALYFGGGTANLAKPEELAGLFETLSKHLILDESEVSLEGVPALFTTWFHAPLKMLQGLPVAQRRISMGIQTFDAPTLQAMGRGAFGDARSVAKLVRRAQSMGITTSGDFLFNLPGQSQRQMLDDVRVAIDTGLEQICLYNLVLYEGLGTLWSQDAARLAAMPDNETACANWVALRAKLLESGYVQSTLTNFERRDVAAGPRAFRYERLSFTPESTDALGFGPLSLSMFVDRAARRAVKLQRSKDLRHPPFTGEDLYFPLDEADLRLLFVTRSLAKGAFELDAYQRLCGSAFERDFAASCRVLESEGLLELDESQASLTPRGMFFSDAVVATFLAQAGQPRSGAGIHTRAALDRKITVPLHYGGMG